nr:MAG TPA: hypothetical protein [Caudoviricetes sp.]
MSLKLYSLKIHNFLFYNTIKIDKLTKNIVVCMRY